MSLTQTHAADAAPRLTPTEALTRGFTAVPAAPAAETAQKAESAWRGQGFRVGPLGLMVGYADGSELMELPAVYRLPNAPAWFLGIANLHGAMTPVFDLATYLGVTPDPAAKRMLLVLLHGADAAGVVIDGLPRRLRREAGALQHEGTAPPQLAGHVHGATLIDDQLWFDLDVRSLLGTLEQVLADAR